MKEKIIEIIKNACALEEEVTQETELQNTSLDSLSFIEAIVNIEKEFNIEFDFEQIDLSKWVSVNDIIVRTRELYNEKSKK